MIKNFSPLFVELLVDFVLIINSRQLINIKYNTRYKILCSILCSHVLRFLFNIYYLFGTYREIWDSHDMWNPPPPWFSQSFHTKNNTIKIVISKVRLSYNVFICSGNIWVLPVWSIFSWNSDSTTFLTNPKWGTGNEWNHWKSRELSMNRVGWVWKPKNSLGISHTLRNRAVYYGISKKLSLITEYWSINSGVRFILITTYHESWSRSVSWVHVKVLHCWIC